METRHIPVPESYYTSPLDRCLSTANITFNGLKLPTQQPCVPEVKELLREVIGIHTCDRRSSKGYIRQNFPSYTFEPGFAEEDEMWRPDIREDHSTHDVRISRVFGHGTQVESLEEFLSVLFFRLISSLNVSSLVRNTDSKFKFQTRMKKLLDDIYSRDDSTYISLTTHSGSIASLLRVIGHREFRLQTGAMIPVLVKAETALSESS